MDAPGRVRLFSLDQRVQHDEELKLWAEATGGSSVGAAAVFPRSIPGIGVPGAALPGPLSSTGVDLLPPSLSHQRFFPDHDCRFSDAKAWAPWLVEIKHQAEWLRKENMEHQAATSEWFLNLEALLVEIRRRQEVIGAGVGVEGDATARKTSDRMTRVAEMLYEEERAASEEVVVSSTAATASEDPGKQDSMTLDGMTVENTDAPTYEQRFVGGAMTFQAQLQKYVILEQKTGGEHYGGEDEQSR